MKKYFLLIVLAAFSTQAAYSKPFKKLVCKRLLSDKLEVTTKNNRLNFLWKNSGTHSIFPLLRAFTPAAISDGLLKKYRYVDVELEFDLNDCSFNEDQLADFKCNEKKEMQIAIKAKTGGAYREDSDATVDVYKGKISATEVKARFAKKNKSSYLVYDVQTTVDKKTHAMKTSAFETQYSRTDGFRQDPDCTVDNAFVIAK